MSKHGLPVVFYLNRLLHCVCWGQLNIFYESWISSASLDGDFHHLLTIGSSIQLFDLKKASFLANYRPAHLSGKLMSHIFPHSPLDIFLNNSRRGQILLECQFCQEIWDPIRISPESLFDQAVGKTNKGIRKLEFKGPES